MDRHPKTDVANALHAAEQTVARSQDAIEQTRRIYGASLLTRGLLWVAVYALSRWLLDVVDGQAARVAIALMPLPLFAWFFWTWMSGVLRMDELERRIELEALAFAFPIAVVFFATLGLLDVALLDEPRPFSVRSTWLMLPMLYYVGLWRAQRRYR